MTQQKLIIRPYGDADEVQVVTLWERCFPDNPPRNAPKVMIAQKLLVQPELFLVGALGQQVVATAMGGYDGHRGWVYAVATAPEHRRCGHARALIAALEAALAKVGCPKLNLQVRADNAAVVAFYEALGYSVEPRVSMGKLLSPPRPE